MNFVRFGIIAAAHVVALGIVYLLSSLGREEEGTATAGANGLVNWSNQESNADRSIVGNAAGPFDGRSGDLSGYNAGDPQAATMVASNTSSSRQRFEPTRPDGSGPSSGNSDNSQLRPVGSSSQSSRSKLATPLPSFTEYTVVKGDSLWRISAKHNVSIAEIESANPGLRASSLPVGKKLRIPRKVDTPAASGTQTKSATPAVEGTTYTVKSGDSLSRIAANQGMTVVALKAANGLRGDIIRVGQKLVVPNAVGRPNLADKQWPGRKVVIKPGDTLGKIAALYDADVKEIIRINKIENERRIRIGQTILIPEKASSGRSSAEVKTVPDRGAPVVLEKKTDPAPSAPVEPLLEVEEDGGLIIEDDSIDEPLIEIEE